MRLIVGALLGVLATAAGLSAQESIVQVDGKAAFLYMNETPCAYGSGTGGLTLGLNARSRGRVGVSASADLLLSGVLVRSDACIGVGPAGPLWTYGVTSYRPGARLSLGLGYELPVVAAVHSELGARAGILPTKTDYGRHRAYSVQPWFGGFMKVKSAERLLGLEVELGRHRLPNRVYLWEEDVLVAERTTWHWLFELGLSAALVK